MSQPDAPQTHVECVLDADHPHCLTHDDRCDWVECTGWRCPTSGLIVTKQAPERLMSQPDASRSSAPAQASTVEQARARVIDRAFDRLAGRLDVGDALDSLIAAVRSEGASQHRLTRCPDEIANHVAQRVAELPNRTSPDDWPEAMLVTSGELAFIVTDEINEACEGASQPAQAQTPCKHVWFRRRRRGLPFGPSRCRCCGATKAPRSRKPASIEGERS